MANLKVSEGDYKSDGAFHTASVSSYLPNKFGLFNTIGNAAEMTSKKALHWAEVGITPSKKALLIKHKAIQVPTLELDLEL